MEIEGVREARHLQQVGATARNGKNAELGIFDEMPSSTKCGVN
jgi:hypothetical protein